MRIDPDDIKTEELIITEDFISFKENPSQYIMMKWEEPLMSKHSEIVCQNGGDILEIGFGMGLSANFIQSHSINSHTIIEINPQIYEIASEWAKDKNNVTIIKGDWYSIMSSMDENTFDGVFYDGYGGKNEMLVGALSKKVLKNNGIFTYYNAASNRDIYKLGDNFNNDEVEVTVDECDYVPSDMEIAFCPWGIIKK